MKNITTSRITASSRWYCTHSAMVNTCSGLLAPKIYASPRLPATTMVVGAFCRSHARESCAMVICCASAMRLSAASVSNSCCSQPASPWRLNGERDWSK